MKVESNLRWASWVLLDTSGSSITTMKILASAKRGFQILKKDVERMKMKMSSMTSKEKCILSLN